MALTMREGVWRPALTHAVLESLKDGGVIVDLGCGTGTQSLALVRERPDLQIIGIDGDPDAIAIAARKPGAEMLDLRLGDARAVELPDGSVDRMLLVLVLHHLSGEGKRTVLSEAKRCLRADGQLHIVDWGSPADPLSSAGFLALQLLDGSSGTQDHRTGRWHELLAAVGLGEVQIEQRVRTPFGWLEQLWVSGS
ncbi:class I SAM-dependent methyltransferase [Conexibacter sp. DBS9H8]|uniref:class I SAM-dependent methyltransferase n=1 Tax=Conexibacter sp. DBS9H8 TaxID=2937801 RepID=UPI00200C3534|nr:class I SAM-dependent methyltransferase [Conexibacter sp. DBS9H8]